MSISKKLPPDVVKKILCDGGVVQIASAISEMARDGQFAEWQTRAMSEFDIEYQKVMLAIATGDRDAARKITPDLADAPRRVTA